MADYAELCARLRASFLLQPTGELAADAIEQLIAERDNTRAAIYEAEAEQLTRPYRQRADVAESAQADAKRDVERYRWLRDKSAPELGQFFLSSDRPHTLAAAEIDAAIDAAMAQDQAK